MNDSDALRDDEIVSAYLDGEATADERARVENDPRLQARLAELRRAAAAVGTPHFFADSPGRDELIARALTAAESSTGPSSEPKGASGAVVDLDAARRHRRRLTILSAAAAVLLVVLAVPLLTRDDPGTSTDLAGPAATAALTESDAETGTDAADRESGDSEAPVADAVSSLPPFGATSTTLGQDPPSTPVGSAGDTVVELGSFTTRSDAQRAVTEAIDAALLAAADESATDADAPDLLVGLGADCDAQIRATDDELRDLAYAASFALPDSEHLVLVYALDPTGAVNGTHRIYEVLLPDCTPVGDETI